MAPRRPSNGRSPLVNPQRQITSFFTKSPSSTPSPSPILSKSQSKLNSNPNPKSSPKLSPSTTTPSPLQSKSNKPLLVIGPTQSPSTPAQKSIGDEVIGKRIKVYWPLDRSWYEGCVKSFNKVTKQHLIQYDDAEEELLDLSKEKIEWIEGPVKKFRRLRRISVVQDDDEEESKEGVDGGGDDSTDEDWGKNAEKEVTEDVSESMDVDDEDDGESSVKKKPAKKVDLKKRKVVGEDELSSSKKSKSGADVGGNC